MRNFQYSHARSRSQSQAQSNNESRLLTWKKREKKHDYREKIFGTFNCLCDLGNICIVQEQISKYFRVCNNRNIYYSRCLFTARDPYVFFFSPFFYFFLLFNPAIHAETTNGIFRAYLRTPMQTVTVREKRAQIDKSPDNCLLLKRYPRLPGCTFPDAMYAPRRFPTRVCSCFRATRSWKPPLSLSLSLLRCARYLSSRAFPFAMLFLASYQHPRYGAKLAPIVTRHLEPFTSETKTRRKIENRRKPRSEMFLDFSSFKRRRWVISRAIL